MFGYIRPRKSELLVREFELYKGIYCSLCKQLGKSYGVFSRMTLSYDCTFYAMVAMGLSEKCSGFHQGRCVVNPMKKCTYCNGEQESLVSASALSVIMTYHKIKDDIHDSRFLGRCRAYFLLPMAARAHKKAARDYPELEKIITSGMELQAETERREAPVLDECAEPTAQMLSGVFSALAEPDSVQSRVLFQFGYFLGRWVYLIDAADDMEKDLKNGSFNPFLDKYGLAKDSTPEQLTQARESCNQVLNLTISQAVAAYQLLELRHFQPIIENIVCQGLPQMQKELLFKLEKENENV